MRIELVSLGLLAGVACSGTRATTESVADTPPGSEDASTPFDGGGDIAPDAGASDAESTDASSPVDAGSPAPSFATPPTPSGPQTTLTCNVPFAQALESRIQVGMIGSDVTSVVGVDDRFGGIGANFQLLNNASPGNYVNVVEARSGAGAGWQTSYLVTDNPGGVGIIVFNQAAGNSTGYQWGYTDTFANDGTNIFATGWNPLYSDHIHTVAGGYSPCEGTGYHFDDGAVDILGAKVATAHGDALVWKNAYSWKSTLAQSWPSWSAEQAFYLSRQVAREGNLRLYLHKGSTKTGPIHPYDTFTIAGVTCQQSNGTACNTGPYDYAVLVWNIFGLDIGIALPNLKATSINLETTTYCSNATDDTCGNINFHSWLQNGGAVSFATGQVRTLGQMYYVGTLDQLADLGYPTW